MLPWTDLHYRGLDRLAATDHRLLDLGRRVFADFEIGPDQRCNGGAARGLFDLVLLGLAGLCILGISLKVVFSLFKGQL